MEEPNEEQTVTIEDAKLAVEIFKKALGYRPEIKDAIVGQPWGLGLQLRAAGGRWER